MRTYAGRIIVMGAAVSMSLGCHKVKTPASELKMADTSTANQLIFGFYGVEMHAWRWTAGTFKVGLKPPAGSAQRGAKLRLDLYIPDSQILELGPMTLSASAATAGLEPQTFAKPGAHTYWRDVPADVLDTNIVPIVFFFDRYAAGELKGRELGAVVSAVALLSN